MDPVGNRLAVTEASGDRTTWTYDPANQLTRETRTGGTAFDITHTYDPAGNRILQVNGGSRTTYAYDPADQLTTANAASRTTFTFDGAGNQQVANAAGSRTTYAWDGENRLVETQLPTGGTSRTSYSYDGDGRRMSRQDTGSVVPAVWDGWNLLREAITSVTNDDYVLEPQVYGNLLAQKSSTRRPRYYAYDGLGSADRLTDGSGTVTDSYAYQAYGAQQLPAGPTSNPFQWVGRVGYYADTLTGLDYLRNRYYSAAMAKLISRDKVVPNSLASGPYRYVDNNPVNSRDPSGWQVPDFPHQPGDEPTKPPTGGISIVGHGLGFQSVFNITNVDIIGLVEAILIASGLQGTKSLAGTCATVTIQLVGVRLAGPPTARVLYVSHGFPGIDVAAEIASLNFQLFLTTEIDVPLVHVCPPGFRCVITNTSATPLALNSIPVVLPVYAPNPNAGAAPVLAGLIGTNLSFKAQVEARIGICLPTICIPVPIFP